MTGEVLVPGPAQGLAGLLDLPADLDDGSALPPLWHWVYLLPRPAQADLGRDGHARTALASAPDPSWQRMWAGGRVRTNRPLRLGAAAESSSRITDRKERTGRSGRLQILTVQTTITQGGTDCVVEEQDLVYREPAALTSAPAAPASPPEGHEVEVTASLLFRFSALTYNAHRIHYDVDYCRDVEHYTDLVVHGPLQALLMAEQARSTGAPPESLFSYRLHAPLLLGQGLHVAAVPGADGIRTTVTDSTGRQTASGLLSPAG